jgi:hypothetical protein
MRLDSLIDHDVQVGGAKLQTCLEWLSCPPCVFDGLLALCLRQLGPLAAEPRCRLWICLHPVLLCCAHCAVPQALRGCVKPKRRPPLCPRW